MPSYTRPTQFTTGQLLGRANASVLRDNDDYFWGLAHGWQAIPGNLSGTDNNGVIYDGYHYYKPDATDLVYAIRMNAGADSGAQVYFYYDYGGANQIHVADLASPGTVTATTLGNYDISVGDTRKEGLYRVYCEARWGCTGHCWPPYTVYTGEPGDVQTYSTPPLEWDGTVSTAGFYNRVRLNDLYFNACQPTNIAFSGMQRSGPDVTCWSGYTYHRGTKFYYNLALQRNWDTIGGDYCRVYYDYGGANEQRLLNLTEPGQYEGSVTIDTDAYTYVPGQRYRVGAYTNSGFGPAIRYFFIEPQTTDLGPGMDAADWGYMVMDEFTVGDLVHGRSLVPGFVPGDMHNLRRNDRHIFSALCASARVGRRDYAVRKPNVILGGSTYKGHLRIVHRYDTLVHRVLDGEMTWAGETQSLEDVGGTGYRTLDLRGLDLAYGQVYKINGSALSYAAEIP